MYTNIPERQTVIADERVALTDQERSISEEWIFMEKLLGQLPAAHTLAVKPFLTEVHFLTWQILLQVPNTGDITDRQC